MDPQLVASECRKSILRMCFASGASHVGSALSSVDILSTLYANHAKVGPGRSVDSNRDMIVLSKGHAVVALYSVLAECEYFPRSWLDTYGIDGSLLSGHPTVGSVPGVEFSTGSLGHGLPFGCGVALGRRKQGVKMQVYVVISDGECDEGSTWESALFAAHHELDNVTVLIDRNGIQSLGSTEETLALEPLDDKWRSFGWHVQTVDGHNHDALKSALVLANADCRPSVIICTTTKGKGVSFMENSVLWHYRSPDEEQYVAALSEISSS